MTACFGQIPKLTAQTWPVDRLPPQPEAFTTLAVGFAVFQVFTVDFVEAEHREATTWNHGPPRSIADAVQLIWPHRIDARDGAWPPPAFPNDSFDRIANWDKALRRGAA